MSNTLNQQQAAAVTAPDRAIAVLAGPGSGKTRTLSARAAHLLSRDRTSRALLLTFMNKAAAEMKARCLEGATFRADRIWAGTFHAFGTKLLRDHGSLIDIEQEFEILDIEEAVDLGGAGKSVHFRWGQARLARTTDQSPLRSYGAEYEEAKRKHGLLDFDDLVVLAAELLEQHPALAEAYGRKYPHLLIDEFQDTDDSRFAIVRALAPHVETISAFADDDQAIMGFAGAQRENVKQFCDELGASVFPLTRNYRSGSEIVAVANALIAADPLASGRQMTAEYDGGRVELRRYLDQESEAADVVSTIQSEIAVGPAEGIAVLVRVGYRADVLEARLRAAAIPMSDWRTDIVDLEARRHIAATLSVIRSRLAARHEARLCDLAGISATQSHTTVPLLEALQAHPLGAALMRIREAAFEGADVLSVVELVRDALRVADAGMESAVDQLVESVRALQAHDPEFSLEHLLADLALGTVGHAPTTGGGLKLATLHRTKGLEWSTVFILGAEEGVLPSHHATTQTKLSEERRLCFVGVSRAKVRLILTSSRRSLGRTREPSQFLTEMRVL